MLCYTLFPPTITRSDPEVPALPAADAGAGSVTRRSMRLCIRRTGREPASLEAVPDGLADWKLCRRSGEEACVSEVDHRVMTAIVSRTLAEHPESAGCVDMLFPEECVRLGPLAPVRRLWHTHDGWVLEAAVHLCNSPSSA